MCARERHWTQGVPQVRVGFLDTYDLVHVAAHQYRHLLIMRNALGVEEKLPPVASPSASGSPFPTTIFLATSAVVASQIAFVLTAYCHAFLAGVLAPHRFHISAVLDDDERSMLCTCVGVAGLCSMVLLELCRQLPRRRLRAGLAAVSGSGIVLTCIVREGKYRNGHRCTAVVAFSAAVALVWVVSTVARSAAGLRGAYALVALVVLTGSAQFANIIAEENFGYEVLPSWALGSLELALCALRSPNRWDAPELLG